MEHSFLTFERKLTAAQADALIRHLDCCDEELLGQYFTVPIESDYSDDLFKIIKSQDYRYRQNIIVNVKNYLMDIERLHSKDTFKKHFGKALYNTAESYLYIYKWYDNNSHREQFFAVLVLGEDVLFFVANYSKVVDNNRAGEMVMMSLIKWLQRQVDEMI